MPGRKVLIAVSGVLLLGLLVAGVMALMKVPRPALPLPAGQSVVSVRGNCASGNELLFCGTEDNPRSFLTVRAGGDPRVAADTLFTALQDQRWRERLGGSTARDFAGGGAPETLEPLYCKDGCVGLFRYQADGFELAWFDR